jgi:membrane protease YdiL (CAAX protease family)
MHPALADIVIVLGGVLVTTLLASALKLPYAGSIGVVAGLLLSTLRLKLRSQTWGNIGLSSPGNALHSALAAFALYFLTLISVLVIVEPVSRILQWEPLDLSSFKRIQGDGFSLGVTLLLVWTVVAFGEEMVFRGLVLSRLEELLGTGRRGTVLAVGVQAILFGLGHLYLGPRGVLTAAVIGAIYGTWFLMRGRTLWPLILAHGLTDTISILAIYSGLAAGLTKGAGS